MTLNRDEAKRQNDQLYDDATQAEIIAVLASDGPQYRGEVAAKIGKTARETGEHLKDLYSKGEIDYKWTIGKYCL